MTDDKRKALIEEIAEYKNLEGYSFEKLEEGKKYWSTITIGPFPKLPKLRSIDEEWEL